MHSRFRTWWQPPRLHDADEEERRVSWLELFYDLVFVVVIARLAHHLSEHPDAKGAVEFVLPFVAVWWVWIGGTFYNERFETYDLSFRIFTLLQMFPVAAMAVFADTALGRGETGFALAYAASRVVITFMWWRGGRHNPTVRPVTDVYVLGFSASILLWVGSVFVDGPLAFALRGLGLAIDLATPFFTLSAQRRLFHSRVSKLPERFGLFVIIVLGEALVGVVNGLADDEAPGLTTLTRFVLGLVVGFGLWWMYFDFVGRRETTRGRPYVSLAWSYLHLPLVMGIAAVGATIEHAVALEGAALEGGARAVLAGAFALTYACIGLLEYTLAPEDPPLVQPNVSSGLKIATALAALLLAFVPLAASPLLGALVGLHLVNAAYGVFSWYRHPISRANTTVH